MMYAHGSATLSGHRSGNEDAVWVSPLPVGVIGVVADGMGGLQCGSEASSAVIRCFQQAFSNTRVGHGDAVSTPARLLDAAAGAHRCICAIADTNGTPYGAGSTVCAAVLSGGQWWVVHLGDTRCYYVTPHEIRRLTTDHSLAAQEQPYVLTRSLGETTFTGGVITPTPPLVGVLDEACRFMIVTDGVHGVLSDEHLHSLIMQASRQALNTAAQLVVEAAIAAGSRDNVSCVLLDHVPSGDNEARDRRRWWQRWRRGMA